MRTQNSLFINTLRHQYGHRPPVWFMRQAGRVLPKYRELSAQYGFSTLMREPDLAARVTLLPVEDLGVDAAILFSDILVIPMALGVAPVWTPQGPSFPHPLLAETDPLSKLQENPDALTYIYSVLDKIIQTRQAGTPLIGFCGGPLTILCYMLQGTSQRGNYNEAIAYCYSHRKEAQALIEAVTKMTQQYVRQQVAHGIDAFQLFESYAGEVPADVYREWFLPSVRQIMQVAMEEDVPAIYFGKGLGAGIEMLTPDCCTYASVDWQITLATARKLLDPAIGLQGNMDPRILFAPQPVIERQLKTYLPFFREHPDWIFSLGYGLINGTPVENVRFVVDWIKRETWV